MNTEPSIDGVPQSVPEPLRSAPLDEVLRFMMEEGFSREAHGKTRMSWTSGELSNAIVASKATFYKAIHGTGNISQNTLNLFAVFFLKAVEQRPELHKEWVGFLNDRWHSDRELRTRASGNHRWQVVEKQTNQSQSAPSGIPPIKIQSKASNGFGRRAIWPISALASAVFFLVLATDFTGLRSSVAVIDSPRQENGFGGIGGDSGGSTSHTPGGPSNGSGFGEPEVIVDARLPMNVSVLSGASSFSFVIENDQEKHVQVEQITAIWCHKTGDITDQYKVAYTLAGNCFDLPDFGIQWNRQFTPYDPGSTLIKGGEVKVIELGEFAYYDYAWQSDEDQLEESEELKQVLHEFPNPEKTNLNDFACMLHVSFKDLLDAPDIFFREVDCNIVSGLVAYHDH